MHTSTTLLIISFLTILCTATPISNELHDEGLHLLVYTSYLKLTSHSQKTVVSLVVSSPWKKSRRS